MALFQNILKPPPPPGIKSREGPLLIFDPTSNHIHTTPQRLFIHPHLPPPPPTHTTPQPLFFHPTSPPPTRTQLPNLPSTHVIKNIVVFTCHCVRAGQ